MDKESLIKYWVEAAESRLPTDILKIIREYLDILRKNNIGISKTYLFGSYANGNQDKWSDIDLALVSEDFSVVRFFDKVNLKSFKKFVSMDISPLPFLEDDFNKSNFARDEIIAKGIRIV